MKETMEAVVFEDEGDLRIKKVQKPNIKRDCDVLLKIEAASICGSDLQIIKVPAGHPVKKGVILGHEYVGVIEALGKSVKGFSVGDRVAIEPDINCGICYYCNSGSPNLCENMVETGCFSDGGFAEYNVINYKAIHKINKNTSPEVAVFAEPLSCVLNSLEKLKIQLGDTAVVLGAGPIGLLFIKALRAAGVSKIIVSEKIKLRRDVAKNNSVIVSDPSKENLKNLVKKETIIGADIVIDSVGGLLDEAIKCTKKAGKILLFGLNSNVNNTIKPYDITHNEYKIIGSYISNNTFLKAIKILEEKIIDVSDMTTHSFNLSNFKDAIRTIVQGEAIKVLLYPKK